MSEAQQARQVLDYCRRHWPTHSGNLCPVSDMLEQSVSDMLSNWLKAELNHAQQQLAECEAVLVQTRLLASEKLAEKNKRIAELEAQVPKWRDTVNDPPEQGQQVLIDWDGPVREMIVGRYCGLADQGFFDECGNWLNAGMAKKWCELPSPPKESEQGG